MAGHWTPHWTHH